MYHAVLFAQSEDIRMSAFSRTPLGELYQAIQFEQLAKSIPDPKRAISGKGCKPWLDIKGRIA
jgi:hypothetical protein